MLKNVHEHFRQHLAGVEVVPIPEATSSAGPIFAASNRVFTLKSDAPTEQDTGFHPGLDPMNKLSRLKNDELIHSPENIVKFYKRTGNGVEA